MKLITFKDFSRIDVDTMHDGERLKFSIIINIRPPIFFEMVEEWLETDVGKNCQTLCDHINNIDEYIAYTESDMDLLKQLSDTPTMN